VWQSKNPFRPTPEGWFMAILGPAWDKHENSSQKKLCFVATDQELLADVLGQLAERPDCVYVKYSVHPRDGMYLGRCFLEYDHEVGLLWARFKEHPRLLSRRSREGLLTSALVNTSLD
jgi:hypothetical protein